jgi:hypothetical protein
MKVSYGEGGAIHTGSESCIGARKGAGEALTGVRTGQPLSREIETPPRKRWLLRGADAVEISGRPHRGRRYTRAVSGPRAVREPVHVRNLHAREPGGPMIARSPDQGAGRSGKVSDRTPEMHDVGSRTAP